MSGRVGCGGRGRPAWLLLSLLGVSLLAAGPALAAEEDATDRARAAFSEGIRLVRRSQWAEALAAFAESAALHPHPVTTYNLGACERALGRYTRARLQLQRALAAGHDDPAGAQPSLPAPLAEDARAFLGEIEALLVRATVVVQPAGVTLAVDGRPVIPAEDEPAALVAGVAAPGPGAVAPEAAFTLLLDPGHHVLLLATKGYREVVLERTLSPGERPTLRFELARLPARLDVQSGPAGAAVAIDGVDVGVTPLLVERPAGHYRLQVRKRGFVPYDARVGLAAGETVSLMASLPVERPPLQTRWWFWTALGGSVTAAGVVIGVLAQPIPAFDGGGLGYVAHLR